MAQEECCQGCDQKHECQEVYHRLGSAKGPSVALKVVVAFLLPMLVFVVSLAIFEKILSRFEMAAAVRTVLSVVGCLSATVVFVLVAKRLSSRQSVRSQGKQ